MQFFYKSESSENESWMPNYNDPSVYCPHENLSWDQHRNKNARQSKVVKGTGANPINTEKPISRWKLPLIFSPRLLPLSLSKPDKTQTVAGDDPLWPGDQHWSHWEYPPVWCSPPSHPAGTLHLLPSVTSTDHTESTHLSDALHQVIQPVHFIFCPLWPALITLRVPTCLMLSTKSSSRYTSSSALCDQHWSHWEYPPVWCSPPSHPAGTLHLLPSVTSTDHTESTHLSDALHQVIQPVHFIFCPLWPALITLRVPTCLMLSTKSSSRYTSSSALCDQHWSHWEYPPVWCSPPSHPAGTLHLLPSVTSTDHTESTHLSDALHQVIQPVHFIFCPLWPALITLRVPTCLMLSTKSSSRYTSSSALCDQHWSHWEYPPVWCSPPSHPAGTLHLLPSVTSTDHTESTHLSDALHQVIQPVHFIFCPLWPALITLRVPTCLMLSTKSSSRYTSSSALCDQHWSHWEYPPVWCSPPSHPAGTLHLLPSVTSTDHTESTHLSDALHQVIQPVHFIFCPLWPALITLRVPTCLMLSTKSSSRYTSSSALCDQHWSHWEYPPVWCSPPSHPAGTLHLLPSVTSTDHTESTHLSDALHQVIQPVHFIFCPLWPALITLRVPTCLMLSTKSSSRYTSSSALCDQHWSHWEYPPVWCSPPSHPAGTLHLLPSVTSTDHTESTHLSDALHQVIQPVHFIFCPLWPALITLRVPTCLMLSTKSSSRYTSSSALCDQHWSHWEYPPVWCSPPSHPAGTLHLLPSVTSTDHTESTHLSDALHQVIQPVHFIFCPLWPALITLRVPTCLMLSTKSSSRYTSSSALCDQHWSHWEYPPVWCSPPSHPAGTLHLLPSVTSTDHTESTHLSDALHQVIQPVHFIFCPLWPALITRRVPTCLMLSTKSSSRYTSSSALCDQHWSHWEYPPVWCSPPSHPAGTLHLLPSVTSTDHTESTHLSDALHQVIQPVHFIFCPLWPALITLRVPTCLMLSTKSSSRYTSSSALCDQHWSHGEYPPVWCSPPSHPAGTLHLLPSVTSTDHTESTHLSDALHQVIQPVHFIFCPLWPALITLRVPTCLMLSTKSSSRYTSSSALCDQHWSHGEYPPVWCSPPSHPAGTLHLLPSVTSTDHTESTHLSDALHQVIQPVHFIFCPLWPALITRRVPTCLMLSTKSSSRYTSSSALCDQHWSHWEYPPVWCSPPSHPAGTLHLLPSVTSTDHTESTHLSDALHQVIQPVHFIFCPLWPALITLRVPTCLMLSTKSSSRYTSSSALCDQHWSHWEYPPVWCSPPSHPAGTLHLLPSVTSTDHTESTHLSDALHQVIQPVHFIFCPLWPALITLRVPTCLMLSTKSSSRYTSSSALCDQHWSHWEYPPVWCSPPSHPAGTLHLLPSVTSTDHTESTHLSDALHQVIQPVHFIFCPLWPALITLRVPTCLMLSTKSSSRYTSSSALCDQHWSHWEYPPVWCSPPSHPAGTLHLLPSVTSTDHTESTHLSDALHQVIQPVHFIFCPLWPALITLRVPTCLMLSTKSSSRYTSSSALCDQHWSHWEYPPVWCSPPSHPAGTLHLLPSVTSTDHTESTHLSDALHQVIQPVHFIFCPLWPALITRRVPTCLMLSTKSSSRYTSSSALCDQHWSHGEYPPVWCSPPSHPAGTLHLLPSVTSTDHTESTHLSDALHQVIQPVHFIFCPLWPALITLRVPTCLMLSTKSSSRYTSSSALCDQHWSHGEYPPVWCSPPSHPAGTLHLLPSVTSTDHTESTHLSDALHQVIQPVHFIFCPLWPALITRRVPTCLMLSTKSSSRYTSSSALCDQHWSHGEYPPVWCSPPSHPAGTLHLLPSVTSTDHTESTHLSDALHQVIQPVHFIFCPLWPALITRRVPTCLMLSTKSSSRYTSSSALCDQHWSHGEYPPVWCSPPSHPAGTLHLLPSVTSTDHTESTHLSDALHQVIQPVHFIFCPLWPALITLRVPTCLMLSTKSSSRYTSSSALCDQHWSHWEYPPVWCSPPSHPAGTLHLLPSVTSTDHTESTHLSDALHQVIQPVHFIFCPLWPALITRRVPTCLMLSTKSSSRYTSSSALCDQHWSHGEYPPVWCSPPSHPAGTLHLLPSVTSTDHTESTHLSDALHQVIQPVHFIFCPLWPALITRRVPTCLMLSTKSSSRYTSSSALCDQHWSHWEYPPVWCSPPSHPAGTLHLLPSVTSTDHTESTHLSDALHQVIQPVHFIFCPLWPALITLRVPTCLMLSTKSSSRYTSSSALCDQHWSHWEYPPVWCSPPSHPAGTLHLLPSVTSTDHTESTHLSDALHQVIQPVHFIFCPLWPALITLRVPTCLMLSTKSSSRYTSSSALCDQHWSHWEYPPVWCSPPSHPAGTLHLLPSVTSTDHTESTHLSDALHQVIQPVHFIFCPLWPALITLRVPTCLMLSTKSSSRYTSSSALCDQHWSHWEYPPVWCSPPSHPAGTLHLLPSVTSTDHTESTHLSDALHQVIQPVHFIFCPLWPALITLRVPTCLMLSTKSSSRYTSSSALCEQHWSHWEYPPVWCSPPSHPAGTLHLLPSVTSTDHTESTHLSDALHQVIQPVHFIFCLLPVVIQHTHLHRQQNHHCSLFTTSINQPLLTADGSHKINNYPMLTKCCQV